MITVSKIDEKDTARMKAEYAFCDLLKAGGINFSTGVPCGVQKYIIKKLSEDEDVVHVIAQRESEAIGIAAGASLAGKMPIVYMQNSGFLNSINDITSLLMAYEIPLLFTVSWRGAPGEDAPQHFINGRITLEIIKTIGLPFFILTADNMQEVVKESLRIIKQEKKSVIILISRGNLG